MKYRQGFVTNSSSSSYIISIKNPIPAGYESCFKKITKDNLLECILNKNGIEMDECVSYNLSNEEVKNLLGIDEKILPLLKLMQYNSGDFDDYLLLLKKFKENPELVLYEYSVDWDWEFDKEELRVYISTCDIILSD